MPAPQTSLAEIYPIENLLVHSWVVYTGNGITKTWALISGDGIPIDYLAKEHIKVYFDRVPKTLGFHYVFSSDGRSIIIDPALPAGVKLHINRDTPTEPLVDFTAASIWRTTDLDTATLQAIFIAEEGLDYLIGIQRGSISIGNADKLDGLDSLAFVQVGGDQDVFGNKQFHTLRVTERLRIPTWDTANRPNNPGDGMFGINTEYDLLEVWNATDGRWVQYRDLTVADTYYVKAQDDQYIGGEKTFLDKIAAAKLLIVPNWNNGTRPAGAINPIGSIGVNREDSSDPYLEFTANGQWHAVPTMETALAEFVQTGDVDQLVQGNKIFEKASFTLHLGLPVWTTATRPGGPQKGAFGYNDDADILEIYNGTGWVSLSISDVVTLTTQQTITGSKTFQEGIDVQKHLYLPITSGGTPPSDAGEIQYNTNRKEIEFSAQNTKGEVIWYPVPKIANPNLLLNGAFQRTSRGSSFINPASGDYTADRWQILHGDLSTYRSIEIISDLTSLNDVWPTWNVSTHQYPVNWIRYYRQGPAGNPNTHYSVLRHVSEFVSLLRDVDVTLSFFARSPNTTLQLPVSFVQKFGVSAGGSPDANTSVGIANLTNDIQYFSFPFRIPPIGGKTLKGSDTQTDIEFYFPVDRADSYTVDIGLVKLEFGTGATLFTLHNGLDAIWEIDACRRFYYAPQGQINIYGNAGAADQAFVETISLPTSMRRIPTVEGLQNNYASNSKDASFIVLFPDLVGLQVKAVAPGGFYYGGSDIKLSAEMAVL